MASSSNIGKVKPFLLSARFTNISACACVEIASVMDNKFLVKMAKSLGDPNRLRLVQEIARGHQMGCADLFQFVPISQPSMSQHLKVLVDAGLVESHKEGSRLYLAINPAKLQELESFLNMLKVK